MLNILPKTDSPSQPSRQRLCSARWRNGEATLLEKYLRTGRFDVLTNSVIFRSARSPGTHPDRPGMAPPDPPDISKRSSEIVDFRSRGGGPAGHPLGVQVETGHNTYVYTYMYKGGVPPLDPPKSHPRSFAFGTAPQLHKPA